MRASADTNTDTLIYGERDAILADTSKDRWLARLYDRSAVAPTLDERIARFLIPSNTGLAQGLVNRFQ
jgi:hypothetical protein